MEVHGSLGMIRHSALLTAWIVLLVGALLYGIQPDEMQIAYHGIRRKAEESTYRLMVALRWRELKLPEMPELPAEPTARSFRPDPFRPYGPSPEASKARFWAWLGQPERLWFLSAAFPMLWLRRRARLKRHRFAAEQKMAVNLSRAVRQM